MSEQRNCQLQFLILTINYIIDSWIILKLFD